MNGKPPVPPPCPHCAALRAELADERHTTAAVLAALHDEIQRLALLVAIWKEEYRELKSGRGPT